MIAITGLVVLVRAPQDRQNSARGVSSGSSPSARAAAFDRNGGNKRLRNPALGRAKRTRDWLRVELEHFEQQLLRENTESLRTRIALIRGLYFEAQGKVKQLEQNARPR